jgi:hypothetical protein
MKKIDRFWKFVIYSYILLISAIAITILILEDIL